MKRLLLILIIIMLCGCSAEPSLSVSEPAPSVEAWGTLREQSDFESHPASALPESTPSPTPTPTPTPTPAPLPETMLELTPQGHRVTIRGKEFTSTILQDTNFVRVGDLDNKDIVEESSTSDGQLSLTLSNGGTLTFSLVTISGTDFDANAYPGEGAIRFEGQSIEYWIPIRPLAEAMGLEILFDGNFVHLYSFPDKSLVVQGKRVPVLMYHAVSNNTWGASELFVSPENMRTQLQYLQDHGFDPIFFSDLTHLEDYDKPILLTFDDGYDDNYTELYPLLQEFNMKATIFVISAFLDAPEYMTKQQVKELSNSGLVSIQSHTVNHLKLGTLSDADQEYQFSQSQKDIAAITGKVPYAISFPTGSYNDTTLKLVDKYYSFGVDDGNGCWTSGIDMNRIYRIYVPRRMTLSEYAAYVGS